MRSRPRAESDGPRIGEVDEGLDRLVFFCDAVIAIAMTLLALDLRSPTGDTDGARWSAFAGLFWDNYFPFLLSFVVIAMYWSSHRRIFLHVERVGPGLIPLNMVFLLMIVTLPFATRLLAEGGHFQVSTVLYATVVALTALSLMLIVQLVWRRGLVRDGAPAAFRRDMSRGLISSGATFLISIPIAFVDTGAAKYSWLVLSLIGDRGPALIRRLGRLRG